jgi:hypothetical protein
VGTQEGERSAELWPAKHVVQLEAVGERRTVTPDERHGRFAGTPVVDELELRGELAQTVGEDVDEPGPECRRPGNGFLRGLVAVGSVGLLADRRVERRAALVLSDPG